MTIKAIIFDVDGTLADTEDAHRISFNKAFAESRLDWNWDVALYGKLLTVTGLSPGLLELEVTEDILLHDEPGVLQTFNRLQALGVSLVFDDFGTGYASLSYLKKFPLDGLKIDRSFVSDLLTDPDDAAIVGSTVGLSHQLGLSVIADVGLIVHSSTRVVPSSM